MIEESSVEEKPCAILTGKERDSESGLDFFGARYYWSSAGRWTSPDWSAIPTPVPYADFTDPQTLNLYAYVRNSPLAAADLDGHGFWKKLGNFLNYGAWTDDEKELENRLAEQANSLREIAANNELRELSKEMGTMTNKQVVDSKDALLSG